MDGGVIVARCLNDGRAVIEVVILLFHGEPTKSKVTRHIGFCDLLCDVLLRIALMIHIVLTLSRNEVVKESLSLAILLLVTLSNRS